MKTLNEYILLDRSGSMFGRWDEVLGSINAYAEEAKSKLKTEVTVATFDCVDGIKFDVIRDKVSSKKWKHITKEEAAPRGMTPLFDAIGRVVSMAEEENAKQTVIVIITDGAENSSQELSRSGAKSALDRCRDRGWQVVFLGADFDAFKQASSVGTLENQTLNMSSGNYEGAMRSIRDKTASYWSVGEAVSFSDKDREKATN